MKFFNSYCTFIFVSVLLLVSCKDKTEKTTNNFSAYLGGIVTDTTDKYIFLFKEDKKVDSLPIDDKGNFFKKFDLLNAGMYTLQFKNQYYNVFFDKNDSLFLKLDTQPFYTTLQFSGKGSEKNNFLLHLQDTLSLNSDFIFKKDYKKFKTSADSIRDNRRAIYLRNKTEISWNKDFDIYPKTLIDYTYYSYLEQFATIKNDTLPEDYFLFRSKTDLNNSTLINYKSYSNYVISLINNTISTQKFKNDLDKELYKLKTLDSLSKNEMIKNNISQKLAFNFIINNPKKDIPLKYLEAFKKLNKNSSQKKQITDLVNDIESFKKQTILPKEDFIDVNNQSFEISKSNGETVLFFWSIENMDAFNEKIKFIKKAAHSSKQTKFIAINIDKNESWKQFTSNDTTNIIFIQATNVNDVIKNWDVFNLNRAILLNPNGTIKESFYDLF